MQTIIDKSKFSKPQGGSVAIKSSEFKASKKSASVFLSAPAPLRHHEVLNKNGWESSKMGKTRTGDEMRRQH